MQPNVEQAWQVRDRFLELHSRWMTLVGEHLQDQQGEVLEYWRIEKADSAIVLPIQNDQFLLPPPSYRPGVGQVTLDFPGGRVPETQTPEQAAIAILKRELGIEATSVTQLLPLNNEGWAVNSSFSNQNLYGFVAHLDNVENTKQYSEQGVITYPVTSSGVQDLLQRLTCLQCRAVLLEWWLTCR
ncbi:NUDIX domain-containing protein [Oscillatoria sp. FACHB-1407]|uniref:NUDIX domain-containing protein n=1 Tax=Oscillatoria sp. FACHB-1407 TaxID=2692847 RepID=UPI001687964E|nr:NUDIX domain-containing protein [Oscillatoria sp. FACHB-1407]MBD2465480.1 NUDIX domain-containing protein [Oscillatoria sp. FACHB-1407]